MSNKEQLPANSQDFSEEDVMVCQENGINYISGEDLGKLLGLDNPRKAIHQIYRRKKDELEPHSISFKVMPMYEERPSKGGPQRLVRMFSKSGCYLISMFANTPKSKKVRQWLASVPEKVEKAQACLPAALDLARRQGRKEGATKALALLANPAAAKLGMAGLTELVWLRRRGLTQAEAGELLGISKDSVQEAEKALKELGLFLPAINGQRRKREMSLVLAEALSEPEQPQLPGPAGEA